MVIKNIEFFGFDVETADDLLSINIMVNPENFELKSYRKTPFMSLIIKNQLLVNEYNGFISRGIDMTHHQWIVDKIELYFSQNIFQCFNMFIDSTQYDTITEKFGNRLFHTMIYYKDIVLDTDLDRYPVTLVGAFPIQGIVSPITKSKHYQLYNGCLIHCKPFRYNDEAYNKVLYVLVDIQTFFSFQEFIPGNDMGKMVNTTYSVDNFTEQCTVLTSNKHETSLTMRGHETFFSKPCKNIFHLSDVPKDILTRSESFSLRI